MSLKTISHQVKYKTNDRNIRTFLMAQIEEEVKNYSGNYKVIPELGLRHGASRVDIAVINGVMHGYEIKSDKDNLERLDLQIEAYNKVFDKMTIVVGSTHLLEVFRVVPEWWGIEVAHMSESGTVSFNVIRSPQQNINIDPISVARLLWREEALLELEKRDKAKGFRSKNRDSIYERLVDVLEFDELLGVVRHILRVRTNWRLA